MGFDGSFQTGSTGPIGFSQTQPVPPVSPYTPAIPRYEIAKVNGRQGALEFPMGPNSSIFLGDNTNENRIWMVITDSVGTRKVISIKGTIDEEADPETKEKRSPEEFDKRLKRVEELINEQRTNNSRSSKPKSGSASTIDASD